MNQPFLRPQMHILARRLQEIDTSPDGNRWRAYRFNQRRREFGWPNQGPRWWAAPYEGNSYLPPPPVKYPSVYFYV